MVPWEDTSEMEQLRDKRSFREFLPVVDTGHLLTALSSLVSIHSRNGSVRPGPLPGMIQHISPRAGNMECPPAHEQDWCRIINSGYHCRVIGERGGERPNQPESRSGYPDDHSGENSADDKNCKEEVPDEEKLSDPCLHGGEHLGIGDGIVNTAEGLEETEARRASG